MKLYDEISLNYCLGPPIKQVEELEDLAANKKSIYHKTMKMKPAAVILSMQTRTIIKMVKRGKICKILRKKDIDWDSSQ